MARSRAIPQLSPPSAPSPRRQTTDRGERPRRPGRIGGGAATTPTSPLMPVLVTKMKKDLWAQAADAPRVQARFARLWQAEETPNAGARSTKSAPLLRMRLAFSRRGRLWRRALSHPIVASHSRTTTWPSLANVGRFGPNFGRVCPNLKKRGHLWPMIARFG